MADDRYERTTHDGKVVDKYTKVNLVRAEKRLGYDLTIVQGSYHTGVGASAGTHDGGGVVDLAPYDWRRKVRVLRELGFAAWHRPYLKGVWGEHIHAVLIGNTKASAAAKAQVTAYKNGRNGLANNGPDNFDWRPDPIVNAVYQTPKPTPKMHLRLGQFNLPGPDKLDNADARLVRAAALINAQNLHAISINEAVGPGKDSTTNEPSPFAADLLAALGSDWRIVVPTTAWNENYVLFNSKKARLSKQYDDLKVYARIGDRAIPGRHLTRVVLADLATGRGFFFGSTHLVNNDRAGAAAQAPIVMAGAKAVVKTQPIFIAGDMNTPYVLTGFTTGGLSNARVHAVAATARNSATYAKYSATKPSTDPDWIIDHLYVDDRFVIDGYTVVLDTTSTGLFKKPRPSDHSLVIIAATEK